MISPIKSSTSMPETIYMTTPANCEKDFVRIDLPCTIIDLSSSGRYPYLAALGFALENLAVDNDVVMCAAYDVYKRAAVQDGMLYLNDYNGYHAYATDFDGDISVDGVLVIELGSGPRCVFYVTDSKRDISAIYAE